VEAQKAVSPVSTGIHYGLLTATVAIIADFLTRIAGFNILVYGSVTFIVGIVVAVMGIVFAHRAFRRSNNNLMTYNQGVIIALIIIVLWSVMASLFNCLYVNYIDPDFVDRLKAEMTAFLERSRIPDNRIAESVAGFEELRPPLGKALLGALGKGVSFGLVLGLIISAFTKRKVADFE
jgi:hypothetical protein